MSAEESSLVKIALVTCGSEYAGVQPEFEEAAAKVNAKFIYPEIDVAFVDTIGRDFGLEVASGDLRLMMARAKAVVEGITNADGVFITTCFRCAEGAIVRNEVRRYIHEHSNIPVISYSFTESTVQVPCLLVWKLLLQLSDAGTFLQGNSDRTDCGNRFRVNNYKSRDNEG